MQQRRPCRGRQKALRHQALKLLRDVVGHLARRPAVLELAQRHGVFGQHRGGRSRHFLSDQVETCAPFFQPAREAAGVSWQRVSQEGPVERHFDDLLTQLFQRAQRHVRRGHAREIRDVLLQVLQRLLDLQGDQATKARTVLLRSDLGLVEDLDLDVAATVDECRKPHHRLRAPAHFQQFRQFTKGPRGVGLRGGHGSDFARRADRGRALGRHDSGQSCCGRHLQHRQGLKGRTRLTTQLGLQARQVAPCPELAPVFVDDAEIHEQVRPQLFGLEVVALHRELRALAHRFQQRIDQPAFTETRRGAELGREVRQRHQPRARALVQALQQRQHLAVQHAGHQPFAALFADLVECIDRHGDRQPVLGITGLVQVAGGAIDAAQPHGLRERRGGDTGRLVAHQLVTAELQQRRLALHLVAEPALQRGRRAHLLRQQLVVEAEDQVVVDQHVLPACLVLQLLHLRNQLAVVGKESQLRLEGVVVQAGDQGLADEDLARRHRVDAREIHPFVVVDDDAVERGAFERHHLAGLLLPVRLQQLRLQQVAGDGRNPLRLDGSQPAPVQPCGLDQFGRHQPAARLLAQVRAGVAPELDAARAEVPVVVVGLQANVAKQPGQHRQVDLLVGGRHHVQPPALFSHDGVQLGVDVAPLAHAAHADEAVAQALLLLPVGELVLVVRAGC